MSSKAQDTTFKVLVEATANNWPAVAGQPPAPAHIIDADVATVSGAADKVLLVDAPDPYLLHLEFLSGHDGAQLPPLVHMRNALLEVRHALPVVSVVVVLHPGADARALTGIYERSAPGLPGYLRFEYRVRRLWRIAARELRRAGLAGQLLASIADVTPTELSGIIRRVTKQLNRRELRLQAAELWEAVYLLLGLRYSAEVVQELLRGVTAMKESSTYQATLAEGACTEAKKLLLLVGRERLGQPQPTHLAAVEAINDLNQLEELMRRQQHVSTWQELLAPSVRSRRGPAATAPRQNR